MIPAMKYHREHLIKDKDDDLDLYDSRSFSLYFRESFAIAARKMAKSMGIPLGRLGTLYEKSFNTGSPLEYKAELYREDYEKRLTAIPAPRGRMLLLTRSIGPTEESNMEPLGFRFTTIKEAKKKLAWTCQTSKSKVSDFLQGARNRQVFEYTERAGPGVYLGCYVVRPSMVGGFTVAVKPQCHSQIPMKKIPVEKLLSSHLDLLDKLDGKGILEVHMALKELEATAIPQDKTFIAGFMFTLKAIVNDYHRGCWETAVFIAKPAIFPCLQLKDRTPGRAVVFGLRTLLPVADPSHEDIKLDFVPNSFLSLQQKIFTSDIARFRCSIIREFSSHARIAYQEAMNAIAESRTGGFVSPIELIKTWSRSSSNVKVRGSEVSDEGPIVRKDPFRVPEMKDLRAGIEWDPSVPGEEESKDETSWVDEFFRIVTTEAFQKGAMGAYGAMRSE